MDVRLDGRVALITGGSRGLGLAMAREFAASGARVATVARDQKVLDMAVADLDGVTGFACDVRDADALADLHQAVVANVGPVDILVNNAGTSAAGSFDAVTDADWQNDLDLKLFAAIRLIRACLPAMKEQSWGRVINVLNIGAKAPGARSTPTTVSRAAGMALTKALASEYGSHGILFNALNTGVLVTDQWQRLHQERAPNTSFDDFIAQTGSRVPVGRMGAASEFANLACFLASDAASYITGTAINVDGGLSPVV
ncbi:MAG: SDR family oxidoreductase [Actinomycetia bacterium]|nr:SDR family oxidoreductase [Actinomycetes bacterium]